ncbi:MAG: translation initiation factor IF-2 N-terminal domain-containing protein, partial [Terracidiphilus sp.]
MSKVRINDLAREMEVKSKQILDVLTELGLGAGKTHSSSIEEFEAEKVRAHFHAGSRASSSTASRAPQGIVPKVDLSHISKPGDAARAILARKQEAEAAARMSHLPQRPVATPPPPARPAVPVRPAPPMASAAPPAQVPAQARPEPRRIVPQPRVAAPIVSLPPTGPAIATRPPVGPVVAKA